MKRICVERNIHRVCWVCVQGFQNGVDRTQYRNNRDVETRQTLAIIGEYKITRCNPQGAVRLISMMNSPVIVEVLR
jgi:hypothetical protein